MKMSHFPMTVTMAAVVTTLLAIAGGDLRAADPYQPALPMPVNVLVISYFPVNGDRIDITKTGDWDAPLEVTRKNVAKQTAELAHVLTEGSRYHGYKDQSVKPSLQYKIVDTIEYLEAGPLIPLKAHSRRTVPLTDYVAVLNRVNIKKYVEEKDVKEVWLWGYRGGKAEGWESDMAGPYGNISNSPRPDDMPKLDKTYTLYHYNYQRGTSEGLRVPHPPDRGGAEPRRRPRQHAAVAMVVAAVLGKVRRQRRHEQDHPPRLRLGPLSAQRRPGLRLGQQTLRRDQH